MNIDIFLPIYLFIQVCRSTFVYNYVEYGIIPISFIFYLITSFLLSFIWAFGSKMDLRYRNTFICLNMFTDIKRLYVVYINSFCYFIKYPSEKEKEFCSSIDIYANGHVFFQGICIWYLARNLIKLDYVYQNQTEELWDKIIKDENSNNLNDNNENENVIVISNEEKEKIQSIYKDYAISRKDKVYYAQLDKKDYNSSIVQIKAIQSFYNKTKQYVKASFFNKEKNSLREMISLLFQAPLIGLMSGFAIGWIHDIRTWIFATNTPVFVRICLIKLFIVIF